MSEFELCDDLNDLVAKRVRAAVGRLIGQVYLDCRDGDVLGMVLNRADFPIRNEMEQLVCDVLEYVKHPKL